tara:strand:- start:1358 stop:1780 length:423 start_codon:yes stop_codon:yes gene_type:complete
MENNLPGSVNAAVPRPKFNRELRLNPYDPIESTAAHIAPDNSQHHISRIVRPTIYLHLIAVALTGLGMTHDIRSIIWPKQWIPLIELGLLLGTLGFFVCPLALLVGLARSTAPLPGRMILLAVEAMIVVAHFIAFIPSVQ